jgi:hypothetical protein
MKTATPPIHFAGSRLGEPRHVCAFFRSADEEYRALLPFIKEGFVCGHKAVHVVSPERRGDHLKRLAAAGIDTTAAGQSGQLELRDSAETYLRGGRFDPGRMLEVFGRLAGGDAERGFPVSRIVCQMDWAGQGRSSVADLIEFEARVNDVWRRHDDAVVCVYDPTKFGGETVIEIMRTHPMVVIGGSLHQNPFFVPPAEFLGESRGGRDT